MTQSQDNLMYTQILIRTCIRLYFVTTRLSWKLYNVSLEQLLLNNNKQYIKTNQSTVKRILLLLLL